jgi:aspartyl protease/PDZ domain-containing protein
MNRRSLLALLVVLFSLATAASRTIQTPVKPAASASAVSIPFELVARHIVIKVKINNSRPLSFVLDTGDKVGIVDTERAKELGLNLQGELRVGGAGSETLPASYVKGSTWTIPGLEGFSQPVALALPLGRLAARFGHDFDGIIGSDFIKEFVVEVDYQARVIKLHDKDRFNYAGAGESIPIELDRQGHPLIDAQVTPVSGSPIKGKFVLDIGSGGALALYSPFVAEHRLLGSGLKTIRSIGAGGAGGRTTGQVGRVAELNLGKFKIAAPHTLFSEDKSGAFASTALAGNIGQQIAARFKLFLDYPRKRIILEPAASFGAPFDRAFGGLALSAEDKNFTTFRIIEVLENSPASEVGLQTDDLIIKVNDKPATELTLTKLSEMFELPVAYKLTIRRGEQTLRVTLTPRRMV